MTSSATGLVSLFETSKPHKPPETFNLPTPTRAWSSMVFSSYPTVSPSLLLGVHGGVLLYSLDGSSSPTKPSRRLTGPDCPSRSSPYCLVSPPTGSVHHPSMLLSAWYDSHLRIHDLRLAQSSPVLELSDPWQWADGSAMYSTTFLADHHVAGGGSRHGTVSLFDIRQPKSGWSVFTPGGRGSPVYALQGEGGRLWGVTERRAFVLSWDGSAEEGGLVAVEARAKREQARQAPYGWGGRGRKWGWTVRYNEPGEVCTGYNHRERGVNLFESLVAA